MKLCWEAMEGAPGSCVRGPLTILVPENTNQPEDIQQNR